MVRFTENTLIIEIPCMGAKPLEKLSYLQEQLLESITLINYQYSDARQMYDNLVEIKGLLSAMSLSTDQLVALHDAIKNDVKLLNYFQ